MFVERDTGAQRYFEVPLAKAWKIYRQATQRVSGLARTARGPSMSAGPGKGAMKIGYNGRFLLNIILMQHGLLIYNRHSLKSNSSSKMNTCRC